LLYAYTRVSSILKKIELDKNIKPDLSLLDHELEIKIINLLHMFMPTVQKSTELYKPHFICVYIYALSKNFSRYYELVKIRDSEDNLKVARLLLVESIGKVLKKGLDLLGIDVLDKM
jgi:arginyl-tRNA synthetase